MDKIVQDFDLNTVVVDMCQDEYIRRCKFCRILMKRGGATQSSTSVLMATRTDKRSRVVSSLIGNIALLTG